MTYATVDKTRLPTATTLLLALTLALGGASCSDDGFTPGPEGDGGSTDTSSGPCTDGDKRCSGQDLEQCSGGAWTQLQRCDSSKICTEDLGCIDCLPSVERACKGANVHSCNPDGSFGALIEECLTEACQNGRCGGNCSAASQLIYVVDNEYRLLSFSPKDDAHTFTPIGKLNCPASGAWPAWGGGSTPFSMSVDRQAKAWVLYTSGEIFWVDTKNAACIKSPFVKGQGKFELFGMGFVSDAPGSSSEKLYIFGGEVGALDKGTLAKIDPGKLTIDPIGALALKDKSPELTGTGNAKLFGFFPAGAQSFVAEIDKATGALGKQWPTPVNGDVGAWAFAHWGGRFYIFVTIEDLFNENSMVLRLDPQTGKVDTIKEQLPYRIVGAGVSTCAPTID